jgi:AGZA family xanthine/uracil permease-like MFS transporter
LLNILITVTKIRKHIIRSIPLSLQHAIGGGIGLFVAYIGFLNVGLIDFSSGVPAIATLNNPVLLVFLIGLALAVILTVLNVKGALFISIIATTLLGIPFGVTNLGETISFTEACQALPTTFLAVFKEGGIVSLFTDIGRLPMVLVVIFAFSIMDTFDSIGTFIGTGIRTGIFNAGDEVNAENSHGFKTRFDKALFADATATSIGALIGTSNTTTFVESAAGIGVGGRTGFSSVITAVCFIIAAFLSTFVSAVPAAATAPVLVIVGIMMTASFKDINWSDLDEAIPAFFTGIFMSFCYSISDGIAAGFIFYCIVKICCKKIKEIHPVVWACTALFILNFVLLAFI